MRSEKLSNRQKLFCLLLYIPCLFIGRELDNDIWFILNSGRYIMQHGIPHIEPFTIHEGMLFLMQQWLSATIFWNVYYSLGEVGLILLVVLFYVIFVYITFKLCMFLSENNLPISFTISMIVSSLMIFFMVERPHIFLFLIMVTEIYLLEKFIKYDKGLYLLPLPVISILLINLEAAIWPILFVILLPYLIDSLKLKFIFIEGEGYNTKSLIFATIGMFAAGFVNPYGINAVTYLYYSLGHSELNYSINEMLPTDINSLMGKIIFATISLVFFSQAIYKDEKYKLRYYLLALGTAFLTLSSVRSFCFFIICGVIPLSNRFKNFKIPDTMIKNDKRTLLIRKVLILLIAVTVSFGLIYKNSVIDNSKHTDLVKAVDYLENFNKNDMVLYSGFDEGGYIEFRGFKTYIDPRAEVFLKSNNQKDDIMKEYIDMEKGETYYKDVLNKYQFTYLVVSNGDILWIYLDYDDKYKLIYSSSYYKIYERFE